MHVVTSFHASAVEPRHVSLIMAETLALERARLYRRLFATRFGALALAVGLVGSGFHWLSVVASWCGVALCVVAPAWAWIVELKSDWRLARSLARWGHMLGEPPS